MSTPTSPALSPQGLYDFTFEVLRVVRNALDPLPAKAFLNPGGPVPWDECCDGQAWVRIVSMTPLRQRGVGPTSAACIVGWQVVLAAGVLRCIEVIDDAGRAPTDVEMTRDAAQMISDAASLLQALACSDLPLALGAWAPLGAEGGCAGGEVQMTATLTTCAC